MRLFSICFIITCYLLYKIFLIKKEKWEGLFYEHYDNFNLDPNYYIKEKNIYSINNLPQNKINIFSNYKFSLESKFCFELSKIYPIQNRNSISLFNNINRLNNIQNDVEEHNDIYMCLEQDYYNFIKEGNDNIRYICSLYNLDFYFSIKEGIPIKKIEDIKIYPQYYQNMKNLNKVSLLPPKLIIGIPDDGENSNYNAKKIFSMMNIDLDNNKDYIFIFDTEKELYSHMKNKINPKKNNPTSNKYQEVHIIFNISSYKNTYLIEFLKTNNLKIIGIEGINSNLINLNLEGIFKSKIDKSKYTITNRYGKTNNFIIDTKNMVLIDTISYRVCLLCHKTANKNHIYNFLKKIYGNIDNLVYKLNNYQYLENNNILRDILDPYKMFYLKQVINNGKNITKYHQGAYKFYKKVKFITNKKDNLYNQSIGSISKLLN